MMQTLGFSVDKGMYMPSLRIIIIIDMSVLKSGDSMGGPIGQPTLLELMHVDAANSTSSNQGPMISNSGRGPSPQQPQQQNSYNRPGQSVQQTSRGAINIRHQF